MSKKFVGTRSLPNLPDQITVSLNQKLLKDRKIKIESSTSFDDSKLEYFFLQYNTARGEVLDSFVAQRNLFNTGLISVAGIIGGVAGILTQKPEVVSLIIGFLLPLISSFLLIIWFTEVQKMLRLGLFLRDLEKNFYC